MNGQRDGWTASYVLTSKMWMADSSGDADGCSLQFFHFCYMLEMFNTMLRKSTIITVITISW